MPITPADRVLRLITIWTWIPTFAMLVPFGVISHNKVPPCGIIPMSFSAIYGVVRINNRGGSRGLNIFTDVVLSCILFGLFVPIVVSIRRDYWGIRSHPDLVMLGTFSAAAMLLNLCIHMYFVLRETLLVTILTTLFTSPTCPHCQRDLRLLWDISAPSRSSCSTHTPESKDSYVPVSMVDDEAEQNGGPPASNDPRPSTDDETARLV